MEPSFFNPANACEVENTLTYPVSVGAFEPPNNDHPHAVIEPSSLRAANAKLVEKSFLTFVKSDGKHSYTVEVISALHPPCL